MFPSEFFEMTVDEALRQGGHGSQTAHEWPVRTMNDNCSELVQLWFSAQIRLICYIAGSAKYYRDTVLIFRASSWDDAQTRGVALGRSHEEEYQDADGLPVHWRLKEVVTLDWIGDGDLDGVEVHSHLLPVGDVPVPREGELTTHMSEPTQSV